MPHSPTATIPKRKNPADPSDADHAAKKARKEAKKDKKEKKNKSRSKHKSKAGDVDLLSSAESEFRSVKASVQLTIPPVFASKPHEGAHELLDSMIMRYIPALQGVVLAHKGLEFLESTGKLKADSPFAIWNIGFEAIVWTPEIGMELDGKVNLCSPDHISLLVHRTFNVSIPRHHIPADQWEFEYGPAENDPEFGSNTVEEPQGDVITEGHTVDEETQPTDGAEGESAEKGGRWVHKVTGDRLGGKSGILRFTVVGMTIANQMLSLLGSIQLDPFSPEHVPRSDQPQPTSHDMRASSPLENVLDDMEGPLESDAEEEDPFVEASKLREEPQNVEPVAKAEKAQKKEEKRKKRKVKDEAEDGSEKLEGKKAKKKKT